MNNFTALWIASFSWLGALLTMPLPIYFGGVALSFLDIVIGTLGIFVSFATVRALLKSAFSIAGKDLTANSSKPAPKFDQKRADKFIQNAVAQERANVPLQIEGKVRK